MKYKFLQRIIQINLNEKNSVAKYFQQKEYCLLSKTCVFTFRQGSVCPIKNRNPYKIILMPNYPTHSHSQFTSNRVQHAPVQQKLNKSFQNKKTNLNKSFFLTYENCTYPPPSLAPKKKQTNTGNIYLSIQSLQEEVSGFKLTCSKNLICTEPFAQ